MRRGTVAAITFGELVKTIRQKRNLTTREVASRLGPNVHAALVSQVERGQRVVKEDALPAWSEALDVNAQFLHEAWLESDKHDPGPIKRKRKKSSPKDELVELINGLSSVDRNRVRGYVDALIEQSPSSERR